MNSHYILPVAVAAAIHAVALFSFTKTPSVKVRVAEPTSVPRLEMKADEPDVVELPEPRDNKVARKDDPAPPPPGQPERIVPILDGDFTIPRPKLELSISTNDITIIPADVRGEKGPGVGVGVGPIRLGDLDNSPRTRFQAAPHYPIGAKTTGLTGEVLVEFTVDESGRVIEPHVVRSTDRIFEEPTLRAVAKWQFEPGRRAGRIVRFRMAVPVVFNLNE